MDDVCKNDNDLVLVTGASGYIATHVVQQLLKLGYRVRGTVRSLKDEKKCAPIRKLVDDPKYPIELVEANLLDENSWLDAVKDCTYVIHTASPFPAVRPKNEKELIEPAVNGTLFVFRACVQEGSKVKRVVLTSSVAAVADEAFTDGKKYSETDWPNSDVLTPYPKSKALAEKAAWDFLKEKETKNEKCFELSVINPGFVMGPLIHDTYCTSAQPIKMLMMRELPLLPDIYAPVCDVRDVALAHIRAMLRPEAVSKRHIIVNNVNCSSFQEWALILQKEFSSKNYSVPTRVAPHFFIKLYSYFDDIAKSAVPILGVKSLFENAAMKNNLSIEPTSLDKTIVDMAYSLIERNIVAKKF